MCVNTDRPTLQYYRGNCPDIPTPQAFWGYLIAMGEHKHKRKSRDDSQSSGDSSGERSIDRTPVVRTAPMR